MQKVVERILNLLAYLLTVSRPVTADEIRNTVKGYDQASDDAFRRTFERDKDLLRKLGVPLALRHTDAWEVELGYVVPADEYAIPDPGLTDEERSALLLAAQAVRFGGQATEAAAIFKLGGAPLPSGASIAADLGHDLDVLGELFGAVVDRHRISMTYRGRKRTVEPYGLGHRFGHWYLLAPEMGDPSTVKTFRVDRMELFTVDETADAFDRPSGFDVRRALSNVTTAPDVQDTTATVRFDRDVGEVAVRQAANATIVSRDDDSVVAEVHVTSESVFIGWLIGFDDRAVIESPPELIESFLSYIGGAR